MYQSLLAGPEKKDIVANNLYNSAAAATHDGHTDAAARWRVFTNYCQESKIPADQYMEEKTLKVLLQQHDQAALLEATRGLKKPCGKVNICRGKDFASSLIGDSESIPMLLGNVKMVSKKGHKFFDGQGAVHLEKRYSAAGTFTPDAALNQSLFHGRIESNCKYKTTNFLAFEGSAELHEFFIRESAFCMLTLKEGTVWMRPSSSQPSFKFQGIFSGKALFTTISPLYCYDDAINLLEGTKTYNDGTQVKGEFEFSYKKINPLQIKAGTILWSDGIVSDGSIHLSPAGSPHYIVLGSEAVTSFKLTSDGAPDIESRKIQPFIHQLADDVSALSIDKSVAQPSSVVPQKLAVAEPNLMDI